MELIRKEDVKELIINPPLHLSLGGITKEDLLKGIDELNIVKNKPKGEWIEIKYRKPTEEEKERYPEAEEWFDCELPEDGEEVLVTTAYNNSIAMTTFTRYAYEGCIFEDYDAEDIIAWCRLPEPYIADMR